MKSSHICYTKLYCLFTVCLCHRVGKFTAHQLPSLLFLQFQWIKIPSCSCLMPFQKQSDHHCTCNKFPLIMFQQTQHQPQHSSQQSKAFTHTGKHICRLHTCMHTKAVKHSTIRGQQSHRKTLSTAFDLSGKEPGGNEKSSWSRELKGISFRSVTVQE